MSNGLVIVVDDDPSVSDSLRRLFQSVRLEVETYDSAESFLTRDPPERASCLVLDVRMPGASGLELQESLNRGEVKTPVVFISGHADVSTSVRALKAGAFDFIEKPFDDHQLIEAVQRGIDRDRKNRIALGHRAEIEKRFLKLTPREREVFGLVTTGLSNKQVAYELGASEKTIKIHRGRVMEKMEAGSLPELVRMADANPYDGAAHRHAPR